MIFAIGTVLILVAYSLHRAFPHPYGKPYRQVDRIMGLAFLAGMACVSVAFIVLSVRYLP